MAGDTSKKSEPPKPCCAALEKKLSKLEMGRAALKQAIALMDKRITEMETENLNLKKECEQEQVRAELEREAKEKESSCRIELEKEIHNLKSQIAFFQKSGCSENQDEGGGQLLQSCVLEGEAEMKRLKELLGKERKRADSESKKVEAEKKKAAEAWKLVKAEKSKAEEEKKLAEIERKKAEQHRICLEATKLEVNEVKAKLISEKSKVEETNRKAEAEKHRANKEKKRADAQAVKAEEQRKRAEVERQKATDDKTRADQLSQQLEEERRRKEALEKEMQEILSVGSMNRGCLSSRAEKCGSVPCGDDVKMEIVDQKVLNEQLKLEKMQTRHAKKIAKKEKLRNDLLQQELDLLKHDAMQFSRRLNVLDECLSHGMEGINSLTKIGDSPNRQRINSNNGTTGIEVCDLHCQNENELIKTHYTATDSFDHFKKTGACMRNFLPISGVSCTKTISGINSELESLIGGSIRSKSQNSAICSTSASFSDRQLMGSQDRGVCPITSPRLAEESSKQGSRFTRVSGEVTKRRFSENDGEVAENIDTSHLPSYVKNKLGDKLPRRSRKRKRIQDAWESVVDLHSEDKLHLKIEEMLSLLHDISCTKNNMPFYSQSDENSKLLGNEKCLVLKSSDDFHVKKHKSSEKEKVAQKHKHVAQPSQPNDELKQMDQLEIERKRDVHFCTGASLTAANRIRETDLSCRDKTINAGKSFTDATICFEDMCGGDIMKLLELDNDADEERYRIAMERLLSPTLPEINFCELRETPVDGFDYLVEDEHCRGLIIEEVNLVSSHNFDVIDVEIDSNNHHLLHDKEHSASFFKPGTSVVIEKMYDTEKPHGSMDGADHASSLLELTRSVPTSTQDFQEVPRENHGTYSLAANTVPIARNQNNAVQGTRFNHCEAEGEGVEFKNLSVSQSLNDLLGSSSATDITEAGLENTVQNLESGADKEVGNLMPVSSAERIEVHCFGNVGVMQGSAAKYCVVPSNVMDEDSISRIVCAIENFSFETSMVYGTHWLVAEVLLALSQKQDLMLEEKACVFFSLLLHNMSVMASVNSKCHKSGDFAFCSDSLAIEMNRVVSDGETRSILVELCECNILLKLIEDFLIDRTVLVFGDVSCAPLLSSDSGGRILFLGGGTMLISSKTATFNQSAAGGVILASICTATKNVDFICGASYNILRMCKDDLSWVLTVLHIFASICGKKYFEQSNFSFIMTAIKSMVLLLERGEESVALASSRRLTSASGIVPRFPSCVQCPFAEGAIHIDKVLTMLLEKLNEYANSVIRCQHLKKPVISSIDAVQAQRELTEGSPENVSGVNGPITGLSVSDCLSTDKMVAACKADFASHLSDAISLVELISCYMAWDWVYDNIVPSLLKLVGSHVSEEFLAAILILVGQVGRFGIDVGGYDQTGVEGLRCRLSAFLGQETAWERSLPSQFAAAKALIDLLPLEFEELIQKDLEVVLTGDSTQSSHIVVIKKWFSQLSKEKQSLSCSLFRSPVVQNA